MNKKGFTLIELLATIAILGVIMGIASISVISYINTSKQKSEKIFTDKLSRLVDDYIDLKGSNLSQTGPISTFKKCYTKGCNDINIYQVESIHLNDLVTANLVTATDIKNPKNKEECLKNGKNPEVKIYKDSDYVYYYYIDLSGNNTSCDISTENDLINTLPDNLITALKEKGINIPTKKKVDE